ncbi:ornithine cyclodeaminase family protein [Quadrisphaera sp. KR29]|uniref:ornithine cyclodeaminase family protein n=1 Tax=Quadrisphaera sp. KR29 TaxID=3461391 RepID=UPI004044E97B
MPPVLPHHDADRVRSAVSLPEATALLRQALLDGLDPAAGPARTGFAAAGGQVLTMPAASGRRAGVKLVGVAPGNPALGLPTVTGLYVLFDATTLLPLATLDAPALTALRTPATSLVAVAHVLARGSGPVRAAVVGGGVQAVEHARALVEVLGAGGQRPVAHVDLLVRSPERAAGAAAALAALGAGGGTSAAVLGLASPEAQRALGAADVVVCATSAGEPLFGSAVLREDVVAVAVGSHEPDRRELDAALLARAAVVVEEPATALREAGDVVLAVAQGALEVERLVPLADLVTGRAPLPQGAVVFKGTGMAWQDLVVADAVHARLSS